MAEQTSKQLPVRGAELVPGAPFHPRLGDLALDLAKGGKIGVCVALPSDSSASYQLRPPSGGEDWRARSDGSTLRPLPVPVTHVTQMKRDAAYDHRAQQAALPVTVHYEDGGTCETMLVLTPAQVELYYSQLDKLIGARKTAREHEQKSAREHER
ncbi:hypothetical protein [Streptomyces viridochromogenes]|uniref:Uncharacterized protein n=1 Tax=Streptomyces viridochromogenes Tue57 TaxID=1160705 RepID=L8PFQ3_STRVR|nr:hypothetical protein [Streptomyces viridochromogenes]ELS54913.1 hypothetical protein STVIR_4094 [Streptomyces viridochromogenes Tue57]